MCIYLVNPLEYVILLKCSIHNHKKFPQVESADSYENIMQNAGICIDIEVSLNGL